MVKVLFQATGSDIRLSSGHFHDCLRRINAKELPSKHTEDITDMDGVFVSAVDISIDGGKTISSTHVYLNNLDELMIDGSRLETPVEKVGIKITKER